MIGIELERLFRAPGQISVLRALWKAPVPLTGRQIQQLAGVHNLTAMRCLKDLERLGLLQRRAAGRANLYSLKRSQRTVRDLVGPIFKAEQAAPQRFAQELGRVLRGHCVSAVLYGSVARGQATPASDVDLLVVTRNGSVTDRFTASVQQRAEKRVRDGWGLVLEANVKTQSEVAKHWNSRLMKQIRREGRLVTGKPLEEVRRGFRS